MPYGRSIGHAATSLASGIHGDRDFMESVVTAPSEPGHYARIASPLHTILVLAAQAGLALGTMIRFGTTGAAANVDRVQLYERTMLFQLLMFGLVLVGVWLSGSPLSVVLGDRWRSIREVFRDAGIGVAFLSCPRDARCDLQRSRRRARPRSAIFVSAWRRGSRTVDIALGDRGHL